MSGCCVARSVRSIGLGMALAVATPVVATAQALNAVGTEFVLTMADGRVLRSVDLVGATFSIITAGTTVEVTIASVEEDSHAVGGRVFLHHLVVADAAGRRTDLCSPDAEGRSLGFPVPDGRGGFDLTCTSGAVGKCIRWGYRPWEEEPGGPPMAALHAACVHMARADYGGAGRATTRAGTLIYWCDRFGVQPCGGPQPSALELS
jgi:ADYC domain